MSAIHEGGCLCGRVRYRLHGEPMRVGLCHCKTCRRDTGGPFMAFAVFDRGQIEVSGETKSWIDATDHRHFCPQCGARLYTSHVADGEIEVRLGSLDEAPGDYVPGYELWTLRRESWLQPIHGAAQHEYDRA